MVVAIFLGTSGALFPANNGYEFGLALLAASVPLLMVGVIGCRTPRWPRAPRRVERAGDRPGGGRPIERQVLSLTVLVVPFALTLAMPLSHEDVLEYI